MSSHPCSSVYCYPLYNYYLPGSFTVPKARYYLLMQGKLLQRCTHFLYCCVLSLSGKVNTCHLTWNPFSQKNQWNILVIGNYYVNYQNYQFLMLLTPSDTKRTLMHLYLFTNSAQRELVSMCTQSIRDRN